MLHYKRQRRGAPLEPTGPRVGDPDGYGLYGVLDRDDDSVLCHECGKRPRSLGAHLAPAHGMTAVEYRAAHGLPRGIPLVSLSISERISEQSAARVGSPQWRQLEAARDPLAASQARDLSSTAPAVRQERSESAPERLPERKPQRRRCPICGGTYYGARARTCGRAECISESESRAARRQAQEGRRRMTVAEGMILRSVQGRELGRVIAALEADGVRRVDIAAELGKSPAWVSEHYPQRADRPVTPHLEPVAEVEGRQRWTWEQRSRQLAILLGEGGAWPPLASRLGSWVRDQRRYRERLTPEQVAELELIPRWTWEPSSRDQGWAAKFKSLSRYAEQHGHAAPAREERWEGWRIGAWVSQQRHRRGRLSAEHQATLEGLPGWAWVAPMGRPAD
ncbi:Helicase associated domain protein [Atopobiaceae bacterium HCP3S3_F7]|uniref:Helicase associated domain protein n=2 Tax=Bacillati TaxID=1783272 RepID=UPI003F93B9E0